MKAKALKIIIFISFITLIISSCKKVEGVGGNASVMGTIYEVELSPNTGDTIAKYLALDQDIFILYGNEEIYSDKTSTSSNGMFQFEYLYPGNYTVFVYSDCNNCDGGKEAISISFSVEKKEDKSLGDIYITKY